MTIWTKPSPPIGLADAGLDVPLWSPAPRRPGPLARLRRWAKRRSFLLLVALPTLLVAGYYAGVAAPQYQSEARFLIRGRQAPSPSGLGEMIAQAGFKPASEDAMGVRDYLGSHDAVAALRRGIDLPALWRRDGADLLARLWWPEPSAERLLDYYRRMVTTEYDTTSGITALRVRSFAPEDSRDVAAALLTLSEGMVNRLNARLQDDGLRVAREEVARAEARLAASSDALTSFRERERALDPGRAGTLAVETVSRLADQLAQARAELAEVQRFQRGESPRVVQLRNRIEGLTTQIAEERARNSAGADALSGQLGTFERLSMERELARAQLSSATASLERARVAAQQQQIFLLRVVEPNLAEWARYPQGALNVAYVFLCLSVAYGIAWLLLAGMREHAA